MPINEKNFAFSTNFFEQNGGDPNYITARIGSEDARTGTAETIAQASMGKVVTTANASAQTLTLDSANVIDHFMCWVQSLSAAAAALTPSVGDIDDGSGAASSKSLAAGTGCVIFKRPGNHWIMLKGGSGGGGGGGTWGSITGTLSAQTDLQAALDAKLNASLLSAKGDLITHNGSAPAVRTAGPDGNAVVYDSAQTTGVTSVPFPVPCAGGFTGRPAITGNIGSFRFNFAVSFAANFGGSYGGKVKGGLDPAIAQTCNIYKNTTLIGHMYISTSSAVTFDTVGGVGFTVNAGESLTVVPPAVLDATWAEFDYGLLGFKGVVAGGGIVNPVLSWQGTYDPLVPYNKYDFVRYVASGIGGVYISLVPTNLGNAPTPGSTNAYWALLMLDGVDGTTSAAQVQNQSFVYCGTAGGTANALTLTPSPAAGSLVDGMAFAFRASANNTTAVTVNLSGLGAVALVDPSGVALIAAALKLNCIYTIVYNSTLAKWQQLGGGGGGNTVAKYVLGLADAGLTNALIVPRLQYMPDTQPSPTADDDEFEGAALAGAWSTVAAAGGATFAVGNSRLQITRPAGVQVIAVAVKTRPTAPYEFVIEGSLMASNATKYAGAAVGMRESSTGKMVLMNYLATTDFASGMSNNVDYWNGVGPSQYAGATLQNNPRIISPGRFFLKFADNGTNFVFSWSLDGVMWIPAGTGSRTAFLTSAYNQIAIGAYADNNSPVAYVSYDYIRRTV